jgi:hypothetical protein
MFIPDATLEQYRWFNDLQRASASPENAARIVEGFNMIDVRQLAAQLDIPTLVLHATGQTTLAYTTLAMAGIALVLAALVRPGP